MMRSMGQVIPFEERAVARLRDRLGAAESARQDLIAFARGHSGATSAIHSAVLAMIQADDIDQLFDTVTRVWPRLLGLDHVTLAIVVDGKGFRVESGHVGTVERQIVDRAIEQHGPVTMRTVPCGHPLFGAAVRNVRSEALIVLPSQAPLPYGLLLLGQEDATNLDNRLGVQLLGFLGSGLAAMIRRCLIDN
jgi:uncharacterized protein YigA (DUF484 family)